MIWWKNKTGKTGQRGDTLVEVLISILIVSMILTGAYVTTHRSSLGIRNSQEHGEALKLLQGQIEQVRQNAGVAPAPVFSQPFGNQFCMVDSKVVSGVQCTRDRSDQQATGGVEPAYKLTVQRADCALPPPTTTPPCHKFTFQATWKSVVTDGDELERIALRLYQ